MLSSPRIPRPRAKWFPSETGTGAATMKTECASLRERVANWLAVLALLLVGVVWPPVFGG
jgi:hypothetical protein